MEKIRIKKICLDRHTKKALKEYGVEIKKDRRHKGVRILTLPDDMKLLKYSSGVYFLQDERGDRLGHIFSPYRVSGGLLTFVIGRKKEGILFIQDTLFANYLISD